MQSRRDAHHVSHPRISAIRLQGIAGVILSSGANAELLQGTIPGEWDKLADPLASLELNGNNLTGTHAFLPTLYIILRSLLNSSRAGRLLSPFALDSIFVHSIPAQA